MKTLLNIFLLVVITGGLLKAQDNYNQIRTYTPRTEITSESTLITGTEIQRIESARYFDGLGRPRLAVTREGSPTAKDIVQYMEYNNLGLEQFKYLPYAATSINGYFHTAAKTEQDAFYDNASKVAHDASPWAETDFENSPLRRITEQGAVGSDWQLSTGKTIKNEYGANIDREVINWQIQADGTLRTSNEPYYAANMLHKLIITDEEGNRIVQYTDKSGRNILKKVEVVSGSDIEHHKGWACTYNVYDDYGNLRYVLPPSCIDEIINNSMEDYENNGGTVLTSDTTFSSNNSGAYYYLPWVTVTLSSANYSDGFSVQLLPLEITSDMLNRWAFQYKYDTWYRLIEKKVPGAEWVYMVYDKRDRLVLIQDGVQRAKTTKEWFFTKYDILNRPIISGIFTSSKSRSELQTDVYNHATLFETFNAGGTHGYTNVSFPTTSISQYLTITYYDNYDFLALTEFDSNYDFGSVNGIYTETQNPYVSGLMTGGKVLSLEDGNWLISSLFYDKDYRVIRGKSKHQKGINKVYVKYDFVGNATNTQLVHTYSGEPSITINESFRLYSNYRVIYTKFNFAKVS